MRATTNLLAQFNNNLNKGIWASADYYKSFKQSFETKTKADMTGLDSLFGTPAPYQVVNGIGIIDFKGFTINDANPIEELFFGVISLQNFQKNLAAMVKDDSVAQCLINFDSGGGYVMGGYETQQLISELNQVKPIYAYTSGLMCSNAYFIGSACSKIWASPSSWVGSIGVYCEYFDLTKAMDEAGIKVTTFQGGSEKTVGSPYIPLTPEQSKQIQDDINNQWQEFKQVVRDARGNVNEQFMQGQAFTGVEAVQMGTNLVDGLCNSLTQIVGLISKS